MSAACAQLGADNRKARNELSEMAEGSCGGYTMRTWNCIKSARKPLRYWR